MDFYIQEDEGVKKPVCGSRINFKNKKQPPPPKQQRNLSSHTLIPLENTKMGRNINKY